MRVLVIEDEAVSARRLLRLLDELARAEIERADHVRDLDDAREQLSQSPADLVFLDLDLYGEDGFELLRESAPAPFCTVVVSAHGHRALEAFDHGVVDFVAKPVNRQRLHLALERVRTQRQRDTPETVAQLNLAVRRAGEIRLVAVDQVRFIRAAGDYSELHTQGGERHLHDKGLSALERLLPDHFLRVHRSYIVDSRQVDRLLSAPGSRYRLRLRDGQELPVGRSRVQAVRGCLTDLP